MPTRSSCARHLAMQEGAGRLRSEHGFGRGRVMDQEAGNDRGTGTQAMHQTSNKGRDLPGLTAVGWRGGTWHGVREEDSRGFSHGRAPDFGAEER